MAGAHNHEFQIGGGILPTVGYDFSTADGPEAYWAVCRVTLEEQLSSPFLLTLEIRTEDTEVDTEALLGANGALFIDRGEVSRMICGLIHRVEHLGLLDGMLYVRIQVVPALALLAHGSDTRLWQDLTVVDVVAEVLGSRLAAFDRQINLDHLVDEYEVRELIVQYDESDLAFVSRLLESEGISYWFEHDAQGEREIVTLEDSNVHFAGLATIAQCPELRVATSHAELAEFESLHALNWVRELSSTHATRRTFDWLEPMRGSEAHARQQAEDVEQGRRSFEIYLHDTLVESDPQRRTSQLLCHDRQRDQNLHGHSNAVGLAPGRIFSIVGHIRPDLDGEYLVVRVTHEGDCSNVEPEQARDQGPRYRNRFVSRPHRVERPYRPLPATPRPQIHGPQTAIVAGPEGEDIHTDCHGRIKVHFRWDRIHGLRDDCSAWVRVAQAWAGAGFGTFFVPRIGMEVVVQFLDGNPDQPLVIGCVYNGSQFTSISLPDNKTQSSIRTRSTPNSEGFNEIRFEDATGLEELFVRAQRNLNEVVNVSHSTNVGGNQSNQVGGSQSESIAGDQSLSVGHDRIIEVKHDERDTYHGNRSATVEGDELLNVLGRTIMRAAKAVKIDAQEEFMQVVGGRSDLQVNAGAAGPGDAGVTCANDCTVMAKNEVRLTQDGSSTISLKEKNAVHEADGSIKLKAKGDLEVSSQGGTLTGEAHTEVRFANGEGKISISDGVVSMTSPTKIKLSVGASTITIDAAGISVDAPALVLQSSGVTSVNGGIVEITMG